MRYFPQLLLVLFLASAFCSFGQTDSLSGNNLYFDGSTNYVDTRDTTLYSSFTVECWVKSPNAPSSAQGKGPVHYERNFQINWDHVSSGARNSLLINATNGGWTAVSFGPLEANTWYHLAGTYDGDTLRAYTNGRLVTQKAINGGAPVKENYSMKIGKHAKLSGAQEFFQGSVDEVRVWNVERSADEIRTSMYHPLTGTEPGLKHYYRFNANHIQGDSTQNLATGRWLPMVNNPEVRASEFPLGKGTSTVLKVNANEAQTFNSIPGGLVSLQTDSANRAFPLLFTRLIHGFYGNKPDTMQFKTQASPYWIIQPLDTGIRVKSDLMRLDMTSVEEALGMVLTQPNELKVFQRAQNSAGDWELIDTCSAIAWATGHYIFNGFRNGQMALGVPKTLVSTKKQIHPARAKLEAFLLQDGTNTFLVRNGEGLEKFALLDMTGRKVRDWDLKPSEKTGSEVRLGGKPLPSGMYILTATGAGLSKTGRVWVP
jgi:hypothetical protein